MRISRNTMMLVLSVVLRAAARTFATEPGGAPRGEGGNIRAPQWSGGQGAPPRQGKPTARGVKALLPADWWPATKRAGAGFLEDRVMAEAAGVAFYAMLAVFPAMASLISIYGLVADPARLAFEVQGLSGVLPQGGIDIITGEMKSLASSGHSALGLGLIVSLAVSLWSANAGVKALFDALNTVYHEKEKRSYVRLTLISFCFTLGIIALLMAATVAVVVVPVVLNFVGFASVTAVLVNLLRWPVMLAAVAFALEVIYRFGPSRPNARWRWMTWGSALAALLWLLTSLAFSYYVANFGSYNRTYGSLGAAMGFMTWIWLTSMVVLMGAELNSELDKK